VDEAQINPAEVGIEASDIESECSENVSLPPPSPLYYQYMSNQIFKIGYIGIIKMG
jgi:hypothetical protein